MTPNRPIMASSLKYDTAVVGANGYLGKALVEKLLELDNKVLAVYNSDKNNIPSRATTISIQDFQSQTFEIETIFFLAGSYRSTRLELISLHCDILKYIVIRYKYSKHIFISSTNVYGTSNLSVSLDSPYINPSSYGMAKLVGEYIVSAAKKYSILRLTYLYGPHLKNNSFLPNLINQALIQKEIILFGDGKRAQDYLHINDAVNLCLLASKKCTNEVYLGATGLSYTNNYIANFVASKIYNCKVVYREGDEGVTYNYDPSDTFQKLNWKPDFPFDLGLMQMIECAI